MNIERKKIMKTILEELFNGNIYPDELIIPQDPEYPLVNQKISDTLGLWRKKLSEEDYEQLEDLLDLRSQSDSLHAAASFTYGFKLGAAIILEVLNGKGELVRKRE